jgi:hypothetical protein
MRPKAFFRGFSLLCCAVSTFAFADEAPPVMEEKKEEIAVFLTRSDTIPSDSTENTTDAYFEGYLQALVDLYYSELRVIVIVKDHEAWLANLPKNSLIAKSIISFVQDVPGVKKVHTLNGVPPKEEELREQYVNRPRIKGIWFPQLTELYQPMVADPRQVTNSLGYRQGDISIIGKKVVPVSLGDDFGFYRWLDVWDHGDLQISIEAGIWSVFNMDPPKPNLAGGTAELVNTDFYVGIPLSYALNKWSFKWRVYHISSHLGDEFLVDHPGFERVNPSFEATDLFISYQVFDSWRLYGAPGVILHSDNSFKMNPPLYFEYGTEYRFGGVKFHSQRLYGTFLLAAHFRSYAYLNWGFDGTFLAGYEFSKLQGIGRKFRLFVEYHNGFSLEGQFMKEHTQYVEYMFMYGF